MRPGLLLVAGFLATTAFAQNKPKLAPTPAPLQRSTSVSKQFVIYYFDGSVRSRLARKTEDLKQEWLRRFRMKDEWKAPIIVQIASTRLPDAPRLRTSVHESDGGEMKVQIDVFDPTSLKGPEFDLEVYRALALEYAYRKTPPKAGKAITQPPAWLLEGLYEDTATRDEGIPAGLFEMLVKSGPPPKLEAFLKIRPESLDATSRAVYRAQAMALLRALLGLPGGPGQLAEYLASLPGTNPADAGKLLQKFPELAGEPGNLSKLWTLSLANASASDRNKPFSMAETQRQLALLLDFSTPKDPKKPEAGNVTGPEALQALTRSGPGRYILKQKTEDLLRLELRAHPIMRPIAGEYRIIAAELSAKPGRNLEKRIRKNMELQQAVVQRAGSIEDYLNWFEASQLTTPSREFDATLNQASSFEPFKRNDAISRQLDDLESRGW
ncbi:MAG: hypothetical protein ACOYMS_03615 [Terrimicrobiaceae bacterium]